MLPLNSFLGPLPSQLLSQLTPPLLLCPLAARCQGPEADDASLLALLHLYGKDSALETNRESIISRSPMGECRGSNTAISIRFWGRRGEFYPGKQSSPPGRECSGTAGSSEPGPRDVSTGSSSAQVPQTSEGPSLDLAVPISKEQDWA